MVKFMAYFPNIAIKLIQIKFNLTNLLRLIFDEFPTLKSSEEYNLQKRLGVFQILLSFAKDYILFLHKKTKKVELIQEVNIYILCFVNFFK